MTDTITFSSRASLASYLFGKCADKCDNYWDRILLSYMCAIEADRLYRANI